MRLFWAAIQLVLVISDGRSDDSDGWSASRAELRRYQRVAGVWQPVGAPIAVAVGENGMAWGRGLHSPGDARTGEPTKREGDRRSPAGSFRLGGVYGGAGNSICVDDPESRDYNKIVAGRPGLKGELMSMYRRALVVEHNQPAQKNGGSCIFLHDGDSPTVGCTAMAPAALDELISWLHGGAVIVQLPRPAYQRLKEKWRLP